MMNVEELKQLVWQACNQDGFVLLEDGVTKCLKNLSILMNYLILLRVN